MKATWRFGEDEGRADTRVNLGNGHEISVRFYATGDPPEVKLSNPSVRHWLGDDPDNFFRAWLIAAAKPRVMAG